MTDTPESAITPTVDTERARYDDRHTQPSRTVHVAAWIGIVAGAAVFIAVVFFSGVFLGWSSGSHYGWHRGHDAGMDDSCSMMGAMMRPGGPIGPQPMPTPTAPSTPRP